MTNQRRDADKELFETIGQVKEFMENYRIQKEAEERQRAEDRQEARTWREQFDTEQKEIKASFQNLKSRLDNLTAPARWAVGIAAVVTALGAIAVVAKRFFLWISTIYR